jgi:hypothetical protein
LTSACLPHIFFKKLKKKENKVRTSYEENRGKREKTGKNRDWHTCGRRLADHLKTSASL